MLKISQGTAKAISTKSAPNTLDTTTEQIIQDATRELNNLSKNCRRGRQEERGKGKEIKQIRLFL